MNSDKSSLGLGKAHTNGLRVALGALRQRITDDLAADLKRINRLPHPDAAALIDPPAAWLPR